MIIDKESNLLALSTGDPADLGVMNVAKYGARIAEYLGTILEDDKLVNGLVCMAIWASQQREAQVGETEGLAIFRPSQVVRLSGLVELGVEHQDGIRVPQKNWLGRTKKGRGIVAVGRFNENSPRVVNSRNKSEVPRFATAISDAKSALHEMAPFAEQEDMPLPPKGNIAAALSMHDLVMERDTALDRARVIMYPGFYG